jgi:tungstate transport system ATP-binding protein
MIRDPAYCIRSLMHSYDGNIALDIPRLEIPSGRIYAFTGPNGCGKTTLLSILGLLLAPASGSVLLHGIETVRSRDLRLRRQVTLVHQRPVLFSTTVRNNIAYGLKAHGLHAKEVRNRTQAILEETRLSHVADKQARGLSGGEAQRAVLARALVLETPVILLDEPTNSLDDASRPLLLDLLRKANQQRGATIVMATHDLSFASSLTERIVRMEDGKIFESSGF